MARFNWKDPKLRVWLIIAACGLMYIILTLRLGGFGLPDIVNTIFGKMFGVPELVNDNVAALGFDLALLMGGTGLVIAVFSQFILPVRTVLDRWNVIERVLLSLGANPGPAIVIQNGQIIDHSNEHHRMGKGVILLDTASAAVLHDGSQFTQAVGPGLVFTERRESIYNAVDLHTQIRKIGPMEKDGDPQTGEGTAEEKAAWRERRLQTSGLTRDGVEVIPQITAVFRLRALPGEGNTRFGYNGDSVWRAISHQGVSADAPAGSSERQVAWDWLPVQMAADLWREYLRKYTFEDLFEFPTHPVHSPDGRTEPFARRTVFETIVQQMNLRLSQDLVTQLDEVGKPLGRTMSSREHMLLLQRGLKVLRVSVNNLRFSQDPIEKSLIERWINTWMLRARAEERYINQQQAIEKARGQNTAREEFAAKISRPLYRRLQPRAEANIPPPNLHESLELLMQGALEGIRSNPELLPQLTDVESELADLKEWLRLARNGQTPFVAPPPEADA